MYRLVRVTQPTAEPISLSDAKAHLRVDHSDEDALIQAMISAARDACERYCNRAWAEADFIESFDAFPDGGIALTDPGVKSITRIEYLDSDGSVGTIAGSSLTLDTELSIVDYASWPYGTRIKVFYTAGANADQSAPEYVPESVILAMKLLLTDYYENRGAQQWQQLYTNPTAERLMHSYRVGLGV